MIALGFERAHAQNPDCEPCEQGNVRQVIVPLCFYQYFGPIYDPLNNCQSAGNIPIGPYPYVFVILNIREVNCQGVFKEFIEDAIYVNNENYWNQHLFNNGCNQIISNNVTTFCAYNPPTPQNIKQGIADVIRGYINASNISYSYKEVVVKGTCYSLAKVAWPDGAFIDQPAGDTSASIRIELSGSESYIRIPCEASCCLLRMQRVEVFDGNGVSTYKWTTIGVDQPTAELCLGMPPGDYNSLNPKPKAQIIDPNTGEVTWVEASFVSQEPCEPICPTIVQSNGFFKNSVTTDLLDKKSEAIKLTVAPIPAKNLISFESEVGIKEIKVYDKTGRRVYEKSKLVNNKLDVSDWSNAQYYIQLILNNDEVKTLKILKN